MQEWQPQRALVRLRAVTDYPSLFRNPTPSLARLSSELGEEFAQSYLALWILELQDCLNIPNKMNERQIEFCAQMVFNENPMLTIGDIKLVFEKAATGRFGKDYNRIDSSRIATWFRQHWEERLQEGEQISLTQHQERTRREEGSPRASEQELDKMRRAFMHHLKLKNENDENREQ